MKMIFPSITRVFTTTAPTESSKVTCAFSLTENKKTDFTKKKHFHFFNFLFNRTATTTKESVINEETTMASTTST